MLTQPIRDIICHCQLSSSSLLAENSVTTEEVPLKITAANLYNTRASRRKVLLIGMGGRKRVVERWEKVRSIIKGEKSEQTRLKIKILIPDREYNISLYKSIIKPSLWCRGNTSPLTCRFGSRRGRLSATWNRGCLSRVWHCLDSQAFYIVRYIF